MVKNVGAYNLMVRGSDHLKHLYLEGKDGHYYHIGIHGYVGAHLTRPDDFPGTVHW